MTIRYIIGTLLSIPLLPLMYFHGKRIRKTVPRLPEAKGKEGIAKHHSKTVFRLLCLGESTMAGVGVSTHKEGFAGSLAKELSHIIEANIEWEVIAKSGYTAKQVAEKLVPKIDNHPDLIVIGLGGNDSFQLNSPMQWKKDIQALINIIRVKHPSTPIAFTNMPAIKEFPAFTWPIRFVLGGLGELLGEALSEVVDINNNVYFSSEVIDLNVWTKRYNVKNVKSDFFSDGVHPAKLTYQVWAKDFAIFIDTMILKK